MKNVYLILPDLAAGGAERVTITFARILKNEGFNVCFINLGNPYGEMFKWIVPEFELISFGKSRVLAAIPQLCKFMRNHRLDVFFSSREHVNLVSLISAKLTGTNAIVRIPNMPKNKLTKGISGIKLKIIKTINQLILNYSKQIIAQNDEMRDQLIEYYNLKNNQVTVINNPVDKDYVLKKGEEYESPFDNKQINFLTVCNVAFSKGIDILMESWTKVKKTIPNAHMWIVGRDTSEYATDLKNQASHFQDFSFIGFKENPYPFMKYCDVVVLPSRMEGFPNVVLEAMCFNKPIVATSCVQVINDLIENGNNGFTCDIENVSQLAKCMIKASNLKKINREYSLFDKQQFLDLFMDEGNVNRCH